jgi:hypothetical protein
VFAALTASAKYNGKTYAAVKQGDGRYLVRIPAEAAFTLPVEACEELDGVSYCKTGEVSVSAMHEAVQKLRADGCSIFFAAIGE